MTMTPTTVLWIYIILLVAGGLMGFVKARSKPSLVMSLAFAVALSLCAMGVIAQPIVADILLMVLLVFFGLRFAKKRKFMPGGLMSILSVAALALRHLL
jgi:uncharacterized membrane protein (UPF0136 family)